LPTLDFSGIATLTNSYVTLTCGVYLLHVYAMHGRRNFFHLLWALGFLLYGAEILLNLWLPTTHIARITLFILSMIGWFVGVGFLLPKLRKSFIVIAILTLLLFLIVSFGFEKYPLTLALTPYIMVTVGIILLMKRYGKFLYSLFLGWVFLLAVNLLFLIGFLSPYQADLLAIPAKIIILYGAVNPAFAMVDIEMQRWLLKTSQTPPAQHSHFTLVKCIRTSHLRELSWIKQKVTDNSKRGIKTFLLILYDLISLDELKGLDLLNHKDIHIVRVLRETEKPKYGEEYGVNVFDEESSSLINDDLTSLGFLISRIVKYGREKKIECNIILYSLSWLIHTHGWRNVYLLLTYKMPEIKNSQTYLHAFYYPETHEERTVLKTFEKLAEQIMTISSLKLTLEKGKFFG